MNRKPVDDKTSVPQDKMPVVPNKEVLDRSGKGQPVVLRRIVLPMIPIFVIIFIIAAPLAWLVTPSPTVTSKPHSPPPASGSNAEVSTATKTPGEEGESEKRVFQPLSLAEPKLSPPPPNVYWSVLSQQLLDLERERVAMINSLADRLPPLPSSPVEPATTNTVSEGNRAVPDRNEAASSEVKPSEVKTLTEKVGPEETEKQEKVAKVIEPPQSPPAVIREITWATVSQQVLDLEKQRENTITAVVNQLKQARE